MSKLVGKYLIILSLVYAGASAAEDVPDIGYCSNCSSAGFAWAAEQAAPSTGGMHPVYVIDTTFGEVRYFNVSVWWDCGGNELQSVDDGVQSLDEGGMDSSTLSSCTQKEAIQGVGDEFIISQMLIAHDIVSDFLAPEKFQFDSGDLPNVGDTALDLIGPDVSSAGFARLTLQHAVQNELQGWFNAQLLGVSDLANRLANNYIGEGYSNTRFVKVTFPDGTSVMLRVVDVGINNKTPVVEVEVVTESIELPYGAGPVPQNEGHFDNFSYTGDPNIVGSFIDMANRFGIPITGAGGSGPTLRCVTVDGVRFCERI